MHDYMTHTQKADMIDAFLKENGMTRQDLSDYTGSTFRYINNCLSPRYQFNTPKWMEFMCFAIQLSQKNDEKGD